MTGRSRLLPVVPWIWSGLMAMLVCGPVLLSRGFALTRDMVFVPDQPFKPGWLGLDGSVPRAVPSDAIISLLESVIAGDVLQKVILAGLLLLAGAGAAVATQGAGLAGQLAASTLYVWNPFVFERLAMGHWALLFGYAALPWVLAAAARVRARRTLSWAALCLAMAAAAFTSPTGGVLAGIVCCCVLVGQDRRSTVAALALSVGLNLPWIVPSLLYRGGIPSDPGGVAVFAAHPDTPYGVLGSLVSLGGIWNSDVVPPGRGLWLLSGLLLMVCVTGLAGLRWVDPTVAGGWAGRLVVMAAIGLVLAAAPALPGGLAPMAWIDAHVPGGGLLRDSQKWVALLSLVEALGLAALVSRILRVRRDRAGQAVWWVVSLCVLVPVAVMPALAWGLAGRLQPVSYPRDWAAVASLLGAGSLEGEGGRQGDVAVLPWSIYRQFAWNDMRPVLDPAPRFFPGTVVIADTLLVGRRPVGGEDEQAAAVGRVLVRGGDVTDGLRRLGIGLVVVERHTPGIGQGATVHGTLAYNGSWLQLWVLGQAAKGPPGPGVVARTVMVVGDVAAGGLAASSLAIVMWRPVRRYSRR